MVKTHPYPRAVVERLIRALLPFAAYADAVDKANGAPVLPGHFAMVQPRLRTAGVEIGHEHFFAAREALDLCPSRLQPQPGPCGCPYEACQHYRTCPECAGAAATRATT